MDKNHLPQTLGVFKPVGHTVITYRSAADLELAAAALATQGVASTDLVRYSGPEMVALAQDQELAASPLASFGYEIDLVKANRAHAQEGCSFLVVKDADDAQRLRVAGVAQNSHAVAAQHYGTFMIEELLGDPR